MEPAQRWKRPASVLPAVVATGHAWLMSAGNVPRVTEKLHFYLFLINRNVNFSSPYVTRGSQIGWLRGGNEPGSSDGRKRVGKLWDRGYAYGVSLGQGCTGSPPAVLGTRGKERKSQRKGAGWGK